MSFASSLPALARRGLIDGNKLSELKGGTGYLNVAYDVGALAHILRERWSTISTKSAVQTAELDEAEVLFKKISRAFAERSQYSNNVASAADERARAFTLVVNAYDQLRRVVSFIRWNEGDADKYAPSLWAGRGGRGEKKSTPAPEATEPSQQPSTETQVPSVEAHAVAPGMPGGSPSRRPDRSRT